MRKHATLPYRKNNNPTARRSKPSCPIPKTNTTFARRHFTYLSARIYNNMHQKLNINPLNKHKCKNIVKSFLLTLDYDETEALVKHLNNQLIHTRRHHTHTITLHSHTLIQLHTYLHTPSYSSSHTHFAHMLLTQACSQVLLLLSHDWFIV